MPIELRVSVVGYKVGELKRLGIEFQRPKEVLQKIANARRDTFEFKFRHELDWDYSKTRLLTSRYKKYKDRKFPGKVIRERTGVFRNSYEVIVYQRSVREVINDPKAEFVNTPRPIIPPSAEIVPQNELARIELIANQFFKKIGFK